MFEKVGDLVNYWHVIGLSKELRKGKSLRRMLYGIPILIWRDEYLQLHAVVDCCAHKKAPLSITNYHSNQLTCQYHGWQYDAKGQLKSIPSSPHLTAKLNCQLTTFQLKDEAGFLWVSLTKNIKKDIPIAPLKEKGWRHFYTTMEFDTSEELLIENFMDATHTPLVHPRLIRDPNQSAAHELLVEHNHEHLSVNYAPSQEKIGIGLRWLVGKNVTVSHSDEFLLPNLVNVNYQMNETHRFQAYIACTPLTDGKTLAFIRLSFRFGFLNPLVRLAIPSLAKKVLQQDQAIVKAQYNNQQLLPDVKEQHIDIDYIFNKMSWIRKQQMDKTGIEINSTQKNITLTV